MASSSKRQPLPHGGKSLEYVQDKIIKYCKILDLSYTLRCCALKTYNQVFDVEQRPLHGIRTNAAACIFYACRIHGHDISMSKIIDTFRASVLKVLEVLWHIEIYYSGPRDPPSLIVRWQSSNNDFAFLTDDREMKEAALCWDDGHILLITKSFDTTFPTLLKLRGQLIKGALCQAGCTVGSITTGKVQKGSESVTTNSAGNDHHNSASITQSTSGGVNDLEVNGQTMNFTCEEDFEATQSVDAEGDTGERPPLINDYDAPLEESLLRTESDWEIVDGRYDVKDTHTAAQTKPKCWVGKMKHSVFG